MGIKLGSMVIWKVIKKSLGFLFSIGGSRAEDWTTWWFFFFGVFFVPIW